MRLRKLSILQSIVTALYESRKGYYSRSKITGTKIQEDHSLFCHRFYRPDSTVFPCIPSTPYTSSCVKNAIQCKETLPFNGIIGLDKPYFDEYRVWGKCGRGASGKTIVFGLLKRNRNVYTEIASFCSKATPQEIILGNIELNSVINTNRWKGYDGLVDISFNKYLKSWPVR